MTNEVLVKSVVDTLKEQGKKIATAESCTGGMLAGLITSIPGASDVFDYGIVSYANNIKHDMLNVDEELLETYGAVSEQVALAMATEVMKASNADIGVGITGIAGPDGGTIEKPVGTVFVAITTPLSKVCSRLDLGESCKNNRKKIREKTISVVLNLVLEALFNVSIEPDEDALYEVVNISSLNNIENAKHKAQNQIQNEKWYKRLYNYWIPQRNDSAKQITLKIVSLVCVIAFLVSCGFLVNDLSKYWGAANTNAELKDLYEKIPIDPATGQPKVYDLPEGYLNKFGPLYEQNPDVKGWLKINGTKIDFPVVQTNNNEYYLNRNFYKKYQVLGTTFADYRNKIEKNNMSTNTVLYAHHAKDGQFFSELKKYKNTDFYKKNPLISFDTVYEENNWVIIGAFIVDVLPEKEQQFSYHNFIDAKSQKDLDQFLKKVYARSYFTTDIDVNTNDSLLTLSTCDYEMGEYNDDHATYGRCVVVARKLRHGEDATSMASTATTNTTQRMPFRWYELKNKTNPFINDKEEPDFNGSNDSNSTVSQPTFVTPDDQTSNTSNPTNSNPPPVDPSEPTPPPVDPSEPTPPPVDPSKPTPPPVDPSEPTPPPVDPSEPTPPPVDPSEPTPPPVDPSEPTPPPVDPSEPTPPPVDPSESSVVLP